LTARYRREQELLLSAVHNIGIQRAREHLAPQHLARQDPSSWLGIQRKNVGFLCNLTSSWWLIDDFSDKPCFATGVVSTHVFYFTSISSIPGILFHIHDVHITILVFIPFSGTDMNRLSINGKNAAKLRHESTLLSNHDDSL